MLFFFLFLLIIMVSSNVKNQHYRFLKKTVISQAVQKEAGKDFQLQELIL